MSDFLQDLRHGLRGFRKSPGFSALAVLTLALGIGGGTAVFSVVEAQVLRPLPFEEPHELAWIRQRNNATGLDRIMVSGPNFIDWREQATSFEHLVPWREQTKTVSRSGHPFRARFVATTSDVFAALSLYAARGRVWTSDDNANVAVISHELWAREFGGGVAVGEDLVSTDGVFEIVGVLPEGLRFPPAARQTPEVWLPIDLTAKDLVDRDAGRFWVFGRTRDGVSVEQGVQELDAIAARLAEIYPETNGHIGAAGAQLRAQWGDWARNESAVLLTAVGFVLLIGCVNIANLLLARLSSRSGEMAIRVALGARRGRLIRQLLTESLILAIAGGAAGLLLAYWGTAVLGAVRPSQITMVGEIEIDGRVLSFAALATLLSACLFGVLPALTLPLRSTNSWIRANAQSVLGRGGRMRSTLVAVEIALSMVCLVASGMLIRGMVMSVFEHPGFNPDRLLSVDLSAPEGGNNPSAFIESIHERIVALPGVEAVTIADSLPLMGGRFVPAISFVGREEPEVSGRRLVSERRISPNYLQTMGVTLIRGRNFDERDAPTAPRVALVNRAFIDYFLPGEDALGQRFVLRPQGAAPTDEGTAPIEIVGVVKGEKYWRLDTDPMPELYVPLDQDPMSRVTFGVRTRGEPAQLSGAIRAVLAEMSPNEPVREITTMHTLMDRDLEHPRYITLLFGLFGFLGLALAAIGVFGVMAQTVLERTRELALRAAVGALPRDVVRAVMSRGSRLIVIGIAVGVAAAAGVSQLLQSVYYFRGAPPFEPWTFGLAAASLGAAAFLACYVPARRAAKLDPLVALRGE